MNHRLKRAFAGVVATAIATATVPLLLATPASAVGIPSGSLTLGPTSGNSQDPFTISLPVGAECAEDSAGGDWRVTSFMVPASVIEANLTFDPSGPTPAGVGAAFRQPLWNVGGNPHIARSTQNADTPGGPGAILAPGSFDFGVYGATDIPAGAYDIGIACIDDTSAMQQYWSTTITVAANAGDPGPADISWQVGAAPQAPVLASPLGTGDQTLTATFTHSASTPASTYTATATPNTLDPDCATAVAVTTAPPAATVAPITISGLVNLCEYGVTVRATNTAGFADSNSVLGTPNPGRPPVTGLSAAPGVGQVSLDWSYAGPAATGFTVSVTPPAGATTVDVPGTSALVTGLTPGTVYTFTVTPTYASPPAGTESGPVQATPLSSSVIYQEIEVTRPVGALVLTQRCGVLGALDAEPTPETGWPTGFASAPAVGTTGTAPFTDFNPATQTGTATDPRFADYPYPVDGSGVPNPTYPTHCGITMDAARLVTSGAGSGQFFATTGRLNQVTVVDTRDSDPLGWTLNGLVESFTVDGGGASFSGNHLGWTPQLTDDSDAFDTDLNGTLDYDQTVIEGAPVAPRTVPGLGSGQGRTLGSALEGSDLGIAVLDARLKLLIPVTARNGRYTATLSLNFI